MKLLRNWKLHQPAFEMYRDRCQPHGSTKHIKESRDDVGQERRVNMDFSGKEPSESIVQEVGGEIGFVLLQRWRYSILSIWIQNPFKIF